VLSNVHQVIGWALDRHIEDDLAIAALNMAFRRRTPAEGLTHHSDRASNMLPAITQVCSKSAVSGSA
jgi:transposase InsO family protein